MTEEPVAGMKPELAKLLGEMQNSGHTEEVAVAECLLLIAANGPDSASEEHMAACAQELVIAAQAVLKLLTPPLPAPYDPYQELIREAKRVALKIATADVAFSDAQALIDAATQLEKQLAENVSNKGGRLELHRFPSRSYSEVEVQYVQTAKQCAEAGTLEFDDETIVSMSTDGAYVLGWYFINAAALSVSVPPETLPLFDGSLFYISQSGDSQFIVRDTCRAVDQQQARRMLMARHWDDRLDAAGCLPFIFWHELD